MECGSAAFLNGAWKCSHVDWILEVQRFLMGCRSAAFLNGVWKCSVIEWSVEVQRC